MKKIINVKEITIILISLIIVAVSTNAYATSGLVFGDTEVENDETTTVTGDEYENAQLMDEEKVEEEKKPTTETGNNNTNNKVNNTKVYNTNNSTNLPQTGIEDYNIGILLIICTASAIFTYRKISEYRNI